MDFDLQGQGQGQRLSYQVYGIQLQGEGQGLCQYFLQGQHTAWTDLIAHAMAKV